MLACSIINQDAGDMMVAGLSFYDSDTRDLKRKEKRKKIKEFLVQFFPVHRCSRVGATAGKKFLPVIVIETACNNSNLREFSLFWAW